MKTINKLDNKIKLTYLLLLIVNVALWVIVILESSKNVFQFSISDLENYATIASVLIIFGFISSRLPRLRSLGDSALYEIGYLLIMGMLGLSVSYFNSIANDFLSLEPFVDMFMILAIVLIILILAIRLKFMKSLIVRDYTRRDKIFCMIFFLMLGFLATFMSLDYGSYSSNVRTMTVMMAGMFGGPIVGIPTAFLCGALRLCLGGLTVVPCAISTVICGFLSSAVYIWNGKRFLRTHQSAILMFLFIGFEMLMIIVCCGVESIPIILNIYAPMAFAAVVGIILFKLVISETRDEESDDDKDPETELEELKTSLKKYEERIEKLEEKLNENKSKESD